MQIYRRSLLRHILWTKECHGVLCSLKTLNEHLLRKKNLISNMQPILKRAHISTKFVSCIWAVYLSQILAQKKWSYSLNFQIKPFAKFISRLFVNISKSFMEPYYRNLLPSLGFSLVWHDLKDVHVWVYIHPAYIIKLKCLLARFDVEFLTLFQTQLAFKQCMWPVIVTQLNFCSEYHISCGSWCAEYIHHIPGWVG